MNKAILLPLLLLSAACTRIGPGYVGIEVNEWGDQKGVQDYPIQTGRITYNPISTSVYEFPTFRQTVVWDEAGVDESITFNSKEGAVINADVSVAYSLDGDKVPHLFVKFRQDIDTITETSIRQEVADALSRAASTETAIDVFSSKKAEVLDKAKADLNSRLGEFGFNFELLTFIGALRLPTDVMNSINATIQATQDAISAQNKVVQSVAEADQAIQQARGRAESVKLAATAEAQSITDIAEAQALANQKIAESLTPQLVQWRAIEKWNGVQPTFMSGGTGIVPFINVPSGK
jgi:regulator of protease activity HflC (stomatin/prohibitin superfamily)